MHRPQWAARLALVSLFAATGVGLLTAPAVADPADGSTATPSASATPTPTEPGKDPAGEGDAHNLVITAHGTTVTAGGGGKVGILSIYNQGPNNVVDAGIDFDLGALDTDKVDFTLQTNDKCRAPGKTGIACASIGERTTLDLVFSLTPAAGAEPGPAGTITAVITDSLHDGLDGDAHVLTFPVAVSAGGADLLVWAPDQPFHEDGTVGKIKRGEDGSLAILIANQGDQPVKGVKVVTKLVKGATFTPLEGCTVGADKVTLTCDFTNLSLIPASKDTDPDDDEWSAVEFTPGVHIATDAKSPKGWPDLPGNSVAVEPLGGDAESSTLKAAATLPAGLKGVAQTKLDADATDNTDDFTIMVADADSTGGDDGGQGGGGGGGLPITGAPVLLVAGIGLAVILIGAVLMVVTRRRKPADEAAAGE